jgi:general secretion pathway protein D
MRAYLTVALFLVMPLAASAAEPAPAPQDEAEARRLLDSMTDSEKSGQLEVLRVTDRRLRSQLHCQTAKRMYEDRLYEDAREQAELAVQYDPANEEAKKLLQLADSVLSVRRAQIRSMTEHLERGEQIKRQEQLMKLQSHLDRAKVLIAQATGASKGAETSDDLAAQHKLLEEADRHLVRAREIAKWMPAQVPVKDMEESIDMMLDRIFKERKAREAKLEVLGRERAAAEALKARESAEQFKQRRIRMLMDRAIMLYDRNDFDESGRLARRILDIDPTNADAVALRTRCRVKSIDKRAARTADIKEEAIKDWVELSKRATIPHSRLLVYPEDWDEVSARDSVEERRLQEPEWQRQIRAALEKEVDIEFTEQPLEECINYLRGLTDASIITDNRAFAAGGVDPKTPITMKLSKTRLSLALKWILRMAKLDYALKNGAIFISTPGNLQGELVQKMYDVRDLTFSIEHFPGPELGLNAGGTGAAGAVISTPPPTSVVQVATLQDMIRRVVRPTSWTLAGVQIQENGGRLMVTHQPEVHAQISQLLEDFRKTQTLQVHVEARYVDVRQGFLEEIGVDWGGNPNGVAWENIQPAFDANHPSIADNSTGVWDSGPGRPDGAPGRITQRYQSWNTGRADGNNSAGRIAGPGDGLSAMFVYLGNWQAQVLLRAVQKESKGTVLFAPRLTMFNNQRAHIFVGRQTSYVSGWTSSGDVLTPEVSTAIMDGVALDVRPIVSHDRRYITLELRPTLVRPVGDARQFTRGGGDDDDDDDDVDLVGQQRMSLPELEVRTIRTVVTVPDGGTVLLSGLMTERQSNQHGGIPFLMNLPVVGRLFSNNRKSTDRRNLLILVTAKLILFSEEEQQL